MHHAVLTFTHTFTTINIFHYSIGDLDVLFSLWPQHHLVDVVDQSHRQGVCTCENGTTLDAISQNISFQFEIRAFLMPFHRFSVKYLKFVEWFG